MPELNRKRTPEIKYRLSTCLSANPVNFLLPGPFAKETSSTSAGVKFNVNRPEDRQRSITMSVALGW